MTATPSTPSHSTDHCQRVFANLGIDPRVLEVAALLQQATRGICPNGYFDLESRCE